MLAGGRSQRMGRPKANLPIGDATLIEHVLRALAPAFAESVVAGGDPSLLPPWLVPAAISDRYPGAGPLAGIDAALDAARHPIVFVVACDMPGVRHELARLLVERCAGRDCAVPRTGGRLHPTCAAYSGGAASAIQTALRGGRLRAADVIAGMDTAYVEEPELAPFGPWALRSLNTPEDVAAYEEEVEGRL